MEEKPVVHVEISLSSASRIGTVDVEGQEGIVFSMTRAKVLPRTQWAWMAVERLGLQKEVEVELPAGRAVEIKEKIEKIAERLRRS